MQPLQRMPIREAPPATRNAGTDEGEFLRIHERKDNVDMAESKTEPVVERKPSIHSIAAWFENAERSAGTRSKGEGRSFVGVVETREAQR